MSLTIAQIAAISYQAVLGESRKTARDWEYWAKKVHEFNETPAEKLRRIVAEIRKEHGQT